jgi:hypothetical protein
MKRIRSKQAQQSEPEKPEPIIYETMIYDGRMCRREGFTSEDIRKHLLRDHDMRSSWLLGWKQEDDEIRAAEKKKKRS